MFKRFFDFFPTPKFLKFSYVGVHIESGELHFVEFLSDGINYRLGRFGKESFENNPNLLANNSLKEVLKKLNKEKKIHHVKASLPEEETYLFTIKVQGQTDKEIRDFIEFSLEENVPIPPNEALFNYYIIPEGLSEKRAVVSVVSREVVQKYILLFEECNIGVVSFLVESSALSRAVVPVGYQPTHMLVNISHEKTTLSVVSSGFVQFTSTINFGGRYFTSAIEKGVSVSPEEARKIKYATGLFKPGEEGENVSYALTNAISVLKDEIERVSIYWMKQTDRRVSSIEKIVLSGNDSMIPGLCDYLSLSLSVPTELCDVWSNLPFYKKNVPPINFSDSVSYGTAVGLALVI